MNKERLEAIARFERAYEDLKLVGISFFLSESHMAFCKAEDYDEDMSNDDMWDLAKDGKVIQTNKEVPNFNY